jgi:hypothetical protein
MGLFAPGFKDLGDIMRRMQRGLDAEAERYGLLGCSPWVAMERDYANSICFIMYFSAEKYVSPVEMDQCISSCLGDCRTLQARSCIKKLIRGGRGTGRSSRTSTCGKKRSSVHRAIGAARMPMALPPCSVSNLYCGMAREKCILPKAHNH